MKDIKTRDNGKNAVRTASKTAHQMKAAYLRTKQSALPSAPEGTPEEYADERAEDAAKYIWDRAERAAENTGREAVRETRENIREGVRRFRVRRQIKTVEEKIKGRPEMGTGVSPDACFGDEDAPPSSSAAAPESFSGDASAVPGKPPPLYREDASPSRARQTRPVEKLGKNRSVRRIKRPAGAIKTMEPGVCIKQSPGLTGERYIKTAEKAERRFVRTGRSAIKTAGEAAAAKAAADKAIRESRRAAKAAKAAAAETEKKAKRIAAAAENAVKAVLKAARALAAALAAGGWTVVAALAIFCMSALACSSVFGIFFSGEAAEDGMSVRTAVREINAGYDAKIRELKAASDYDELEMSGNRAAWKEVLAVYAVKTNTDKENPLEVATMDEDKKKLLSDVFTEMNEITHETARVRKVETVEVVDSRGNIVTREKLVTKTILRISVKHKSAEEMAGVYGFDEKQREYLKELLKEENNLLWLDVLYGITSSDERIVEVALSQLGNEGGDPYWSWYGFGSRVEWCACFVSWCENECGYIEAGVAPKYAGCVFGAQWFKEKDQWLAGSEEPLPGMVIFFDWDSPERPSGPQDGQPDHTGIVQKVENGTVYTVEGNSYDSVRVNSYPVGYYQILGYGVIEP